VWKFRKTYLLFDSECSDTSRVNVEKAQPEFHECIDRAFRGLVLCRAGLRDSFAVIAGTIMPYAARAYIRTDPRHISWMCTYAFPAPYS